MSKRFTDKGIEVARNTIRRTGDKDKKMNVESLRKEERRREGEKERKIC